MRTQRPVVAAVALILLAASAARAQSSAAPVVASVEPPVDEVERGVFLAVNVGAAWVRRPPASSGTRSSSTGEMVQLELGYDLSRYLAVSLFVTAAGYRAGSDYVGFSGGAASGDFSQLAAGASLRLNAVGFADGQGVQRTWIYLRAGGGYSQFGPKALFSANPTDTYSEFVVFAGPGLEYYTRLRHFSVGVEVDGSWLTKSKSWGFAVTPNLRYAF